MKRINRYASLRIPTSIDYEYSVNTRKRCKKWELYRRRCVKNIENIKNKKENETIVVWKSSPQ